MSGTRYSLVVPAVLLSSAAFLLNSCAKPTQQAPPPPTVSVVVVHPERVAETEEFAGQVAAVRRVEVRSPVAGIITAEPIEEGAQVAVGQALFQIDRTAYDAAWRGAQARLTQSQSRLDNANRAVARLRPLLAEHAVAQRDMDDADAAQAQARAAVDDAKSSVDRAAKDLSDTEIKAEITGRVGKANLMLGARVTGPGDLLTTIDVVDPVRVSFRPSTQQVLQWRRDPRASKALQAGGTARVRIVLPDGMEYGDTGKLDYVAAVLDSSTGTQEFRAELPNHQRLLVPGEFVRVRLEGLVRDSAILVPQRAVVQALGRQSVYVVTMGDTVRSRDVHASLWVGERWLVDSGLVNGDRVITDGLQKVRPGSIAKPVDAPVKP